MTNEHVLNLLSSWDDAWEKYKGLSRGAGALPGIALIEAAKIIQGENQKMGKQYWQSKIRMDINLAFQQAEAEGWLKRVRVDWQQSYPDFRDAFIVICGEISSYPQWFEQIVKQYDGPDLWWWVRTIQGEQKVHEIMRPLEENKKAPIGFI